VIALGEVIAPPILTDESEAEQQFWVGERPQGKERRTKFRVLRLPNMPLWESEYPALLSHLAVARARGGTVFSLEQDQWNAILEIADDEERAAFSMRKQRASGQGYGLTSAERRAVERHAQTMAEEYFLREGYEVEDVSRTRSYDLHCKRDDDELRVEVKGTTGDGASVFLTRNEVEHARKFAGRVAFFLVRNICLDRSGAEPAARGGEVILMHPWEIDHGTLTPLQFEYRLPPDSSTG